MQKIIITLCALLSIISVNSSYAIDANLKIKPKKVLISKVIEHPAIDATTRGIIDSLAQHGYKRGLNLELRVESAQANSALAAQIANKFVQQEPDVVVAVGTLTAQSFAKYAAANKVKLVFASVTEPLSANLVKSLQQPGNNTTGVSNFLPLEPQLQLFKELQPNLQRLGIMYNPGEINSVAILQQLEIVCKTFGITLVKQAVPRTLDIPQAATKLAGDCDAIFISNDNTMLSAIQSIIKAANIKKIPVYVSDTDAVTYGALAALGPNHSAVGVQAGTMVANILNGKDIASMAVQFPKQTNLYINLDAAKQCNIIVSDKLRSMATKLITADKS